jgi:UDP-N-acetylmuramate--alanine ligase
VKSNITIQRFPQPVAGGHGGALSLDSIREVYFIGIGGIGMSAVARYFHARGVAVSGYDRTSTVLTQALEAEGIPVHYTEEVTSVPASPDLVVYTPAIPAGNKELAYCREQGMMVVKRSDVLQIISAGSFNICIAGTHGKTTITTMVAHLLRDTGYGCNAFLGGIAANYGTNFWSDPRNVCVIEADEYDRSFLKLSPDIAVITAMDADHLDIYGSGDAVEQAFIDFAGCIKPGGLLVKQHGLHRGRELKADRLLAYSLQNDQADAYAANIRMDEGSYDFDVVLTDKRIENVRLNMGGMHNVENMVAAIAVADSLGIDAELIRKAVASFKGVRRRFEYQVKNDKLVYIDDYAHHPEELRPLIKGARALFPGRRCTVIFQPHLFTRTRDFVEGFAEVLDMADQVILLPIYPARELPLEGVTSEIIAEKMQHAKVSIIEKDKIMSWLQDTYKPSMNGEFGELLITAGAGDIDTLVKPLREALA